MKKRRFEFRLIPVVVLAALGLFTLKGLGIVFDGGYTLGQRLGGAGNQITVTTVPAGATTQLRYETTPLGGQPEQPKVAWMQQAFGYPDRNGGGAGNAVSDNIITGSVHGAPSEPPKEPPKDATKEAAAKPEPPPTKPAAAAPAEPPKPVSAAERSILEKLQERRQALDARSRELEMRENMLKTEEQKLDQRGPSAKDTDVRANAAAKKDDIEQARFKGLITMYETMKPKDAAKIFDRLDMKVLLDMASQMKPQVMSQILALMSPEAAERLTVEMATRSGSDRSPNDLPKIDGKPGAM